MPEWDGTDPGAQDGDAPRAPLGALARLETTLRDDGADPSLDVDAVARACLADLVGLPGVGWAAVALTEGGGRRLRFVRSLDPDDAVALDWCHIDAYDDVPLTSVVRTGLPVLSALEALEDRWPWLAARERERGCAALAAVPLPGTGSPIGALLVLFGEQQDFDAEQRALLESIARRTSAGLQHVRSRGSRDLAEELAETEAAAEPGARTASIRLPAEPTAPRQGRMFLRGELEAWGVDEEVVETAQLCLSEVVTNAVNHAHTVADVRVSLLEGVLTVLVRDRGGAGDVVEPVRDEEALEVFGRGLVLVEALTSRWGSERDATGTTVWFALDLDGHAEAG